MTERRPRALWDPHSLDAAERLRRQGDVEAAARVAIYRLEHAPGDAAAHDLYARVLADMGNLPGAESEWQEVLGQLPRHAGAHKGLGFIRFRQGRLDDALDHLEIALASAPGDPAVVQAMRTVRAALQREASPPRDRVFEGLEGAGRGLLLVDARGGVLGGAVRDVDGFDRSELVGGYAADLVHEARRTTAMLHLGSWEWVVVEGSEGSTYLAAPTDEAVLCILRDRGVPAARLTLLAEPALAAAREWLHEQTL